MKLQPKYPHCFGRNNREERRLQAEVWKANGIEGKNIEHSVSHRRIKKAWQKFEAGAAVGPCEARLIDSCLVDDDYDTFH